MVNLGIKIKMTRPKYFTPNEVAIHNTIDDLWVSFLGKVYNLTPLCERYKGKILALLSQNHGNSYSQSVELVKGVLCSFNFTRTKDRP